MRKMTSSFVVNVEREGPKQPQKPEKGDIGNGECRKFEHLRGCGPALVMGSVAPKKQTYGTEAAVNFLSAL